MRYDQFIGLPIEAIQFLEKHKLPLDDCPHCHRQLPRDSLVIGHFDGMFNQAYDLYRHLLEDGYADEFLQASPWSSGPMFFIGLRIYKANDELERTIEWPEDEIEEVVW